MSFNTGQMYALRDQANQINLQTAARSIADLFAREVRRAGTGTNPNCIPPACAAAACGTVSTGVLVAQSSQVRFRADLNSNGTLTDANEDVTYTLDYTNNRITRRDNGSAGRTDILWSGVDLTGSQILYYDSAGNLLDPGSTSLTAAQLLQVMRIRLQLSLTGRPVSPGSTLQQFAREAVDVNLRNRYFVMASCPAVQGAILISYN
jgi:hypothetical protein